MGGRRTTKEELEEIETLTEEGLTSEQIAVRLDRSPTAIRNLRYKKRLIAKIKDETGELSKHRDVLINEVKVLQNRMTSSNIELKNLENEKEKLEKIIFMDRFLLEQILSNALLNLKAKRPDLFTLTTADQIGLILKAILK